MKSSRYDVVVLGAGMVGVSSALQLQRRGLEVALVDRKGVAGQETSFGNAGLIEAATVFPHMFPRELGKLLRYAFNRAPEAHYHAAALPRTLPWLFRYYLNSAPARALRTATAALPLIRRCLAEHEALVVEADVPHLLRRTGWIKLFRSQPAFGKALETLERDRSFGVTGVTLDQAGISKLEPGLSGTFAGAIHWTDPAFIPDPGELAKAYAALFVKKGGAFVVADARTLESDASGWTVKSMEGPVSARQAVVALGPWSDLVYAPLGYEIPMMVKRGYHLHLARTKAADLAHPVLDAENGYLLAPMSRGIRLTTGAEFALRDSAPTPVQLKKALPIARKLFPVGDALDQAPWMGSRPCLPDMLPIIGRAPHHKGLWFNFGHQHHGLTLGPVSGQLLADLVTGTSPFTDPAPYRVERFS